MQITGILRLRATASCERDEKDTARLAQPGWRTYIFWDLCVEEPNELASRLSDFPE